MNVPYQWSFMGQKISVPKDSERRKFPDFQNGSGVFDADRRYKRNSEVIQFVVDFFQI